MPEQKNGVTVSHYRLFILDNNNEYQSLSIDTYNTDTQYRWNVPKSMWGRYFTVSVQAITKKQ